MSKLIVIQGGREFAYELLDEILFVGSGENCGLRIAGEGVAEQHCQILKVDRSYRIIDLSGNGVMVSGHRVAQHALKNGDIVQMGSAQIHFRGADAPAQASHGTRPASRASNRPGVNRPQSKVELKIDPRVTAAAKQRETHVRKGARARGLPLPAVIAIIAAGLGILVWILSGVFGGMSDHSKLVKAMDDADIAIQEQRYEDARKILMSIPEGAPNYRFAQMKLKDLETTSVKVVELHSLSAGTTLYENNIQHFIKNYVETNDPRYKGQTGYLRYVVKRMESWLKEFPGHPKEPEVKALYSTYQPRVPTAPPTIDDVIIESDMEANLRRYGYSYKLLSEWWSANAANHAANEKVVKRKLDTIKERATTYWKNIEQAAFKQIESGKFAAAYDEFHDAMGWFDGIPELHAQAKSRAEEMQKKLNEIQKR